MVWGTRVPLFQETTHSLAPGNAKFFDFVAETGYVTDAERLGDSFVAELYLSEEVLGTIEKKVPCRWFHGGSDGWYRTCVFFG